MSKAFTKEDAGDELGGDEGAEDGGSGAELLPQGSRNYMTPKGAKTLQTELHQLLSVERPKMVETVSWAAGNGDRSENGDYIYGKRRLREIDRRIRFLTQRLDALEIVDPLTLSGDVVRFGATVTVVDEDGAERVYRIVGVDETEPRGGRISWLSPVGRALLQKKVGDAVLVDTPKGEVELEIRKIQFVSLD
ncbi:MAG TPA: transcription elongation factor GreB [Bdellovibrionota bacterium]|nr:transcription elongation factor GreB [Bdellovibrionota bacterium]